MPNAGESFRQRQRTGPGERLFGLGFFTAMGSEIQSMLECEHCIDAIKLAFNGWYSIISLRQDSGVKFRSRFTAGLRRREYANFLNCSTNFCHEQYSVNFNYLLT